MFEKLLERKMKEAVELAKLRAEETGSQVSYTEFIEDAFDIVMQDDNVKDYEDVQDDLDEMGYTVICKRDI